MKSWTNWKSAMKRSARPARPAAKLNQIQLRNRMGPGKSAPSRSRKHPPPDSTLPRRRQGRRILIPKKSENKVVVPTCNEAFTTNAELGFIVFEQVEGNAIDQGEVLGSVTSPLSALVFMEGNVEHPME